MYIYIYIIEIPFLTAIAKCHALALHPFAAIESFFARSCKPGQQSVGLGTIF